MTDYYNILGASPDDDIGVIKSRYRALAKKSHPDLHPGDKQAEARFKEIGEAWTVLSDPEKRAQYDASQIRAPAPKMNRQGKTHIPVGAVDYADIMKQFDSFFGKVAAPGPQAKQQKNPLNADELFRSFMGVKR